MLNQQRPILDAVLNASLLSNEARIFVEAITDRVDLPERLAKMALVFRSKEKKQDAKLLAQAALQLTPKNYRIKALTQWMLRHEAPLWHFGIIHDDLRNETYARALEHWVKPGMTVFEIGTGTGILAMLAVRAGAAHVYTCERRADVAEAAREIIARNGMADRITVIAKDAYSVKLGIDIPQRADLFVAEIVDNTLLGEHVLPLMKLARQQFLKPDAILLPRVVSAVGCLISGKGHHQSYRMESAMGFDLTPFNRFSPMEICAGKGGGDVEPLSDVMTLIDFDLTHDAPQEATRRMQIHATHDGVVEGVMRWLKLDFGDGILFENRPPQRSSWFPQIHLLPASRRVSAGEAITVEVFHNQDRLFVMAES
ncbi:MAG: 50S ribosomal protein L11 methyltransferase [Pseudomonadota bacterium]